jgi:predicted Zn-dependent protease
VAALKEEETISLAENAVKFALKNGADEAEAFVYQGFTTTVAIERGQIAKSSRIIDQGLGLERLSIRQLAFLTQTLLGTKQQLKKLF